ncbi:hypothetical protein ISP15_13765 [Dyella jejuensis]|uniref:Uncharacterized protein n=1 Tax=Dyella jejuensis TaxID=1432009 RepID=A0ABW8JM95_9GAMM
MGVATKNRFFAPVLASMLIAGYAGLADGMPAGQVGPSAPPGDAQGEQAGFAQHFSMEALDKDVQNAILRAGLAPVPFNRIIVRTRDTYTAADQPNPAVYQEQLTLENAGHGLVRRIASVQDSNGTVKTTRFDLDYRGYFPFLTQSVPAEADAAPPVVEARKLLRFDTSTDGHMNFTYLYGLSGGATFGDPGQVVCDSGKRYSASTLNAAIQGPARELDCQAIDTNGMVTSKMKLAYLEKYAVALVLRLQNPDGALDSSIVDFKVE